MDFQRVITDLMREQPAQETVLSPSADVIVSQSNQTRELQHLRAANDAMNFEKSLRSQAGMVTPMSIMHMWQLAACVTFSLTLPILWWINLVS